MKNSKVITSLNQVENIRQLITFIRSFSRPTDIESICTMQDIVGHSCESEIAELIEDTNTRGTMLSLLYGIWNYEDATRYYNKYALHIDTMMQELRDECSRYRTAADEMSDRLVNLQKCYDNIKAAYSAECEKRRAAGLEYSAASDRIAALELENMKLKAKLFDLMTADK